MTLPPKPLVPASVEINVVRSDLEPQTFEHIVVDGSDAERDLLIFAAAKFAAGRSEHEGVPRYRISPSSNYQLQVVPYDANEPGR